MLPLGSSAVEIAKVGAAVLIVMRRAVVAEFGGLAESLARTMKAEVPAAVGVPVMAPVVAFKVRPAGRVPVARRQVTAPVPPIDCNWALQGAKKFKTPFG